MASIVSFRSVLSGSVWLTSGKALSLGLRALLIPILARLLSPEEFGVVGTSLAILMFFAVFSTNGLPAALIALAPSPREDPLVWSTIFWAQSALAGGLTVVILLAATPLAALLNTPSAAPVIMALAGMFFLMCMNECMRAILMKNMCFRAQAIVDVVANVCGASAGIIAAVAGLGLWSLVVMHYVTTLLHTLGLFVATNFRPLWKFESKGLQGMVPFAIRVTVSNILLWISMRSPLLIVTRMDGVAAAGAWTVSQQFVWLPNLVFVSGFLDVLFPSFASMKDDATRRAAAFRASAHATTLLYAPLLLGLWALAEPAMLVVFGDRWQEAWMILGSLALLSGIHAPCMAVFSFLKGIDRTDLLISFAACRALLTVVAAISGAWFDGAEGAAMLMALSMFGYMPITLVTTLRVIGLPLAGTLLTIWRPLLAAICMALVVRHLGLAWTPETWTVIPTLLINAGAGAGLYALVIAVVDPEARRLARKLSR